VATVEQADACVNAEDCFRAAAWPKERLGNVLTKDQVVAIKLERLRRVMEQFPASLWAKRAGLLTGVTLIERNPAMALQFLRAAQRDFPLLDDYVRFWMGRALSHLDDAKEAAAMFESVLSSVPDSNLANQVAFRAGEAWYQASSCPDSVAWLSKAVGSNDNEPHQLPQAWLRLASCYLRGDRYTEARDTLKRLWTKFPQTKEAKEAESLLTTNIGGEFWAPQPEEHYARAQALLGQALQSEGIEELRKFLAKAPASPLRGEARLKLGVAQVRLKLYDQARDTFQALSGEQIPQSDEATVWLARVYLRQGLGTRLLDLSRTVLKRSLSAEQKGQIQLFAGIWLEDQAQYDEAMEKYRQVAKSGEPASQRAEAQWKEGWVLYQTGRYRDAIAVWQHIVDQRASDFEPQALYWIARAHGRIGSPKSREFFLPLCVRFPYTYYCQLAREQTEIPLSDPPEQTEAVIVAASEGSNGGGIQERAPDTKRGEIEQQPAYRRAVELRTLGLEHDAARELTALTDRFSRDPEVLAALSILLNEVGAYHHALRLVRAQFRDKLERTGGVMAADLWRVAYPMGLISTIKMQ
jgi:soluble lytic murein transglycosylase